MIKTGKPSPEESARNKELVAEYLALRKEYQKTRKPFALKLSNKYGISYNRIKQIVKSQ